MQKNKLIENLIENYVKYKSYNNKKTLNQIFNYIMNNKWEYFFILKEFNYKNKETTKYIWKTLRQKLQYYYPDIKILTIANHNKLNQLNFYGLIGNVKLNKVLAYAVNMERYIKNKDGTTKIENGKPVPNEDYLQKLKTIIGDPVYNLLPDLYNQGICEIIDITSNLDYTSINDKIIFYLTKDLNNNNINLYDKNFSHTNNLINNKEFNIEEIEFNLINQIYKNLNEQNKIKTIDFFNKLIT